MHFTSSSLYQDVNLCTPRLLQPQIPIFELCAATADVETSVAGARAEAGGGRIDVRLSKQFAMLRATADGILYWKCLDPTAFPMESHQALGYLRWACQCVLPGFSDI